MNLPTSFRNSFFQREYEKNPFNSLLYSTTRPISSSSTYVPYIILFQHSLSFAKRMISSDPKNYVSYKTCGIDRIQSDSQKDLTGGHILRNAWRSCVEFCHGRVLYIRVVQNIVLHNDDNNLDKWENLWLEKWKENGAIIDFKWNTIGEKDDNIGNTQIKSRPITYTKYLHDLKSFANHIWCTLSKIQRKSERKEICPIPIIFDSLTPLTHLYGSHAIKILLQHLKNPPTSMLEKYVVSSPIIVPYIIETVPPLDHCAIEDSCDTVWLLQDGMMHITRRSSREGGMNDVDLGSVGLRLMKDIQSVSFNGEVNNKNNEDMNKTENKKNIPSNLIPQTISKEKTQPIGKTMNSHNVVLKHKEYEDIINKVEIKKSSSRVNKSELCPRFYLDEDDPEWADIDMDEPDDDLDI